MSKSKYILLIKASELNSLDVLASGARGAEYQKRRLEALGAEVCDQFVVTGSYDLVLIVDFPDDETCLAVGLALNANGLYTEALRAYPPEAVDSAREKLKILEADAKNDNAPVEKGGE